MAEPISGAVPEGQSAIKRCEHCGRDNLLGAAVCGACGTPFPVTIRALEGEIPPVLASEAPPLSAGSATLILGLGIAAQIGGAFIVGMVAGFIGALNSGGGAAARSQLAASMPETIIPLASLASMLSMGIVVVAASVYRVEKSLKDNSPEGAAWVRGSLKDIAMGCGLGMLCAIAFLAIAGVPSFQPTHFHAGPLAKMSSTPGFPRIAWLILALLLAPPIEELLFRGVLYGGYRKSFGPGKAATLVTLIFCLLHVPEVMYFPIAMLGIAGLALTALWMRLRANAIGPAIAVHFSYNGLLAVLQVISSLRGS